MKHIDSRRDAKVYGIGRPLMFAIWTLALWGTGTGIRLVWLFMTDAPKALRLAVLPTVWLPIAVAVVMWIALAAALRRFGTASPAEERDLD
jgi:hypothetical protein